MNFLRDHDIENLKLRSGYGTGDVVLSREEFEMLIAGYHRVYVSRDDEALAGHGRKLCAKIKELQDQVSDLTKQISRGLYD